jgi:putative selenium metabolism protein SsnA
MDLRVIEGEIQKAARTLRPQPAEEVVDLKGTYVMPGMVCAHTHLYSSLARGMAGPKKPPRNFVELLKKIWWKLDEAFDEEAIYYSALAGSIEAIKHGTTTLFDHHASPNAINGSLDIVKDAMSVVGLRGVLCYETTDRGGVRRRDDGLEENERFINEAEHDTRFKGMIGAHASFTLGNDTLTALGNLVRIHDCGVHIHVAEDKADLRDPQTKHRVDIVKRLERFGILTDKSILAHGVHLNSRQLARIDGSGAWLVHNPRSNMNNTVGYAPLNMFGRHSALGTDGFTADMFEESKYGFFRNRESEHRVDFSRLPEMLHAGQSLVSRFFGKEFGSLKKGSSADLIVVDYKPPTPLTGGNLHGHFLFGMNSGMVKHVMVNGEWRMWNRELVGIDEEKIMNEAARVAKKLWKRMHVS